VDAVAGDGGDAPFVDMRTGWAELLKQYPAVDPGRAAAIGGSWGGYGVNLIQGHPEWNFGFKALVSHCGEFDLTYGGYLMDEQTIVSRLRLSSFLRGSDCLELTNCFSSGMIWEAGHGKRALRSEWTVCRHICLWNTGARRSCGYMGATTSGECSSHLRSGMSSCSRADPTVLSGCPRRIPSLLSMRCSSQCFYSLPSLREDGF
jgi:hypothetical protein